MKERVLVLLACLFASFTLAMAQTRRVTGTVVDEAGDPIIGASVLVKGTNTGTITDVEGNFVLATVPTSANTLVVSFVGYATQEVAIASNVTVILASDNELLDEVIVVGYGTQRKKDVTSSISRVGGDELANLATASFDTQLAGRAAGVQVMTPSGILGSTPTYRIRGVSSVNSGTQPLIVVDGMPVTSGDISEGSASYNAMTDINPSDIESVEILKDGAATAIYGSRAANGVVLITTKKGKVGQTKVSYDGMFSWGSAAKTYDLLNAKEFVEIQDELFGNWGMESPARNTGVETDWMKEVFKTGFQHSHTINASGGTEKSQYYFSLGYTNQEGIILSNNLRRFNVKGNLTQDLNKWVKVGLDIQANKSEISGWSTNGSNSLSGAGYGAITMLPNVPVMNPNDPTGYNIDAENRKALGRGGNADYIDNGIPNIVWVLEQNKNTTENLHVMANAFVEVQLPLKGLSYRMQGSENISKVMSRTWWDPDSGDGMSYGGILDESYGNNRDWNWQNILNYNASFGNHNISATAVMEYSKSHYDFTEGEVEELSDKYFSQHIISNTYGQQYVYGSTTDYGLASYLLRANYNYASKYYIGASIRRDGLSKLHKDSRWGTFWGVSGAYRISNEKFYVNSPLKAVLNDLRFRASYATLGNSNIGSGNFPYLGMYGAGKYGTQNTIGWTQMGNNNLKWETTETFDLGIDGALFDGRLNFEFAYWQKNSKDLVMNVPTSPALGIPSNRYADNIGKIKNSGIEFTLGAYIIQNRDFTWHADFNFSTLKNRVQRLYGGNDIINAYTIIREGESYNALYGYEYYGVNKTNGNPIWVKADGSLVQFDTFGDYDYHVYDPANPSDVSQPSVLNASTDRKVLGNSIPTWFGGFNNQFTWKNFDASVFIRFSGGNKIMNNDRAQQLLNLGFSNQGKEILGRWQSEANPGDGMMPKIGYKDGDYLFNQQSTDSHFVEDGKYLKLASVTIGYTFPRKWLSSLGVSKARVYVQGQNLLTWTGFKGLDPETFATDTGWGSTSMPQQRTYTVGVNVTF
ncbi:MAG: TonB-dependent receptor [Bacteroidaceae bacterium]|nr:TonB-dependent receptor [Bacteroidaceae bacterium]